MDDDLLMGISAVLEWILWGLLWAIAIVCFPVTLPLWIIGRQYRKAGYEIRY